VALDVVTDTTIQRPIDVVAAYAADPTNAPRWYVNIESADWQSSPGVVVGAKVAFVARFLGRRLSYTYEMTDVVAGERLVMRTAEGPFPMETTYTWAATEPGATHMTLRNRGDPKGFSRLVAPVMSVAMRRANRQDLRRLKQILEA
jgi:hypothetical protein